MKFSRDKTLLPIIKLTKLQRETLVGLMLGDGHLAPSRQKNNRYNPIAYRLVILQSDKHKEYVFHLYNIFKQLVKKPPQCYEFYDKRNPGKIYRRWYFSTTLHSCLKFYGNMFYVYNTTSLRYVKRVPKNICKFLTTLGLAYWYMDDGAAKWQGRSLGLRYCTDNFTLREVGILTRCLIHKFGLSCTLQRKDKKPRIYIKHSSYGKIRTLIYDKLIDSMRYKFPRNFIVLKQNCQKVFNITKV